MQLNLLFESGTPQNVINDMNTAASELDAAIFNPITINISVGYGDIGGIPLPNQNTSEGTIALPVILSYADLAPLLALNDTHLAGGLFLNPPIVPAFAIGTAQAKALHLIPGDTPGIDGLVGMGKNFTDSQMIAAGLHEITHAMGRIAGLSLDLYRFNDALPTFRIYGPGPPSLPAYFSTDGGLTKLADFGTSSDPGDFLNGGVQGDDPFDENISGAVTTLTHVDLQMMDALGFRDDLSSPFEPKSMLPVAPGGIATISASFLWTTDPDNRPDQLTYSVLSAPTHGVVLASGGPAIRFTQADIDNNRVQYRQNGDGAARDSFTFQVSDPFGNTTPIETFQIGIVNTMVPVIENNFGTTTSLGGRVTIFNTALDTVALGDTPEQVTYRVVGAPAHGTLLVDGAVATGFTQADIDDFRVEYQENGDRTTSDSFTFQASNAAGQATVASFPVTILPVAPAVPAAANLLMTNASGVAVLDRVIAGKMTYTIVGSIDPKGELGGSGDLLGDGRSSYLIRNTGNRDNGQLDVAEIAGGGVAAAPVGGLGSEWQFAGTGGLLGNGRSDFLIRNTGGVLPGQLDVGEVVNGAAVYTAIGGVGPEWQFAGTGDFLGDGHTAFLMRNTGDVIPGTLAVGEVVNGNLTFTDIGGVGPEWEFIGTGNYVDASRSDFLMRNTGTVWPGALVVGSVGNGTAHFSKVGAAGPDWNFHTGNVALLS
jgi:hypothetical protein